MYSSGDTVGFNVTEFNCFSTSQAWGATEGLRQNTAVVSGVLRDFSLDISGTNSMDGATVFVVKTTESVQTAITVSIPTLEEGDFTDFVNEAQINQGDHFGFAIVTTASGSGTITPRQLNLGFYPT